MKAAGARRSAGFTLLEVLIALAIFAAISVMAYGGLNFVIKMRDRVGERSEQLAELQKALTIMSRDITQAVRRGIRDEFGDTVPALVAGSGGYGRIMALTRAGWPNPTGRPRSFLQRVAYGIDDDQLIRYSWPVLDRPQGMEPQKGVLLTGVKAFKVRFLDLNGQWHRQWPPLSARNGPKDLMPKGIEVTLETQVWGEITRLFPIAAAADPAPQQTGP